MSLMTGANNANFCTSVYVVSYGRVGAWCEAHEDRFICMPPDSLIRYLGIYVLVVLRGCVDLCGRREGGMGREWVRKGVGGGGVVCLCVYDLVCLCVWTCVCIYIWVGKFVYLLYSYLSTYIFPFVCAIVHVWRTKNSYLYACWMHTLTTTFAPHEQVTTAHPSINTWSVRASQH